jgi:hypothetical protein
MLVNLKATGDTHSSEQSTLSHEVGDILSDNRAAALVHMHCTCIAHAAAARPAWCMIHHALAHWHRLPWPPAALPKMSFAAVVKSMLDKHKYDDPFSPL